MRFARFRIKEKKGTVFSMDERLVPVIVELSGTYTVKINYCCPKHTE